MSRVSPSTRTSDAPFAVYLRRWRREKGLRQEDVADRLGVTQQSVARWETGDAGPHVRLRLPLAEMLGLSDAQIRALVAGIELAEADRSVLTREPLTAGESESHDEQEPVSGRGSASPSRPSTDFESLVLDFTREPLLGPRQGEFIDALIGRIRESQGPMSPEDGRTVALIAKVLGLPIQTE